VSYYSTDSTEHQVNTGAVLGPEEVLHLEQMMGFWEEEGEDFLDPKAEEHNETLRFHECLDELNDGDT
jgi:hypothetical protein